MPTTIDRSNDPNYVRCSGSHTQPHYILNYRACYACYNPHDGYCADCWNARGGCDCHDCTGEDYCDGDEYEDGEGTDHCHRCGTACLHMDLLTELFMCDCGAKAYLDLEPDRPILFHARSPLADLYASADL